MKKCDFAVCLLRRKPGVPGGGVPACAENRVDWVFAQFLSKISPFVIIYLDLGRILIYDKNDHQGDSNLLSHASRTGL